MDLISLIFHQSIIKKTGMNSSHRLYKFFENMRIGFRYNHYISYLKLAYFDATYVSCVNLFDNRVGSRDVFSFKFVVSLLVLSLMILLPFLLLTYLCSIFDHLHDKELRRSIGNLLMKMDKSNRTRIFLPILYFIRRLVYAIVLVLSTYSLVGSAIQYVIIVIFSALKLIYLMTNEPFQTRKMNFYVYTMEFIFFLMAIFAFMFTDATDDVYLKNILSYIILILLWIFIIVNLYVTISNTCTGKRKLKEKEGREKKTRMNKR